MPPPASSSPAFTACDPAAASTAEKMDLIRAGVSLSSSHKENAAAASGKLLVRNVPFEASQQEVEQVFAAFPGLKSARLPKKLVRGQAGAGSHRGFAFIEYSSRTEAEKAMESLSASTHLYGRRLVLEWAKVDEDSVSGDVMRDKSRVVGSDVEDGMTSKRFKKSDLNSSLRSQPALRGKKADPQDFDPLA